MGPGLPAAGMEVDRRGRPGQAGAVPDLPGIAADHPRPARLPARRHRRDPGRHRGDVRRRQGVHAAGDAAEPAQAQALHRRHPAVQPLPDRVADRGRLRAQRAPALRRLDRGRPDRGADRGGRQLLARHQGQRHRGHRVPDQPGGGRRGRAPATPARPRRPGGHRLHRHGLQQAPARGREPPAERAQVRPRAGADRPYLALRPAGDEPPAPASVAGRIQPDRLPALRRPRPHAQRRVAVAVDHPRRRRARDEGEHRAGAGAGPGGDRQLPAQREAPRAQRDREAPRRADRDRRRRATAHPALRSDPPARERAGRGKHQAQLPARHPAQAAGARADQGAAEHPGARGDQCEALAAGPGARSGRGTGGGTGSDAGRRTGPGRAAGHRRGRLAEAHLRRWRQPGPRSGRRRAGPAPAPAGRQPQPQRPWRSQRP